ncbi:MAG: tetratricopeptide repeat protein [Rubricoccaceae bacterium]|nr:tetratricopeptide repeat protein [Rubricoccaceae bacterium]
MLRITALAALAAAVGLSAAPAQAQDTPPPDTIVVQTPENEARKRFNTGNDLLRQEDYEGALAMFEEGLSLDPTNNRNAYGRALALAQLDREDDAVEAFEQAIALSDAAEDAETGTAARRALGLIMYNRALGLLAANPLPQATAEEALPLLAVATEGGVEANQLPYQLARVHNVLGNYDEAERYAQAAVEANEGQDDMSAYYIELGLARMNAGNADGAREAFEMAREGSWSGWAEHYLRELDGDGAAGG